MTSIEMNRSNWLRRNRVIPGSTNLFGKRRELHCVDWPSNFTATRGIYIKSNRKWYMDMTMCGVGCSILGYNHKEIVQELKRQLERGSHCTLNSDIEIACAEELLALNTWGSKAKFFRSGGEACAAAVRIARASSGRTKVLVHGYHGWHDWYLSAALSDEAALDKFLLPNIPVDGVPKELKGTIEAIQDLTADNISIAINNSDQDIAALVLEIGRNDMPNEAELKKIRDMCTQRKILLIFDEITSGFRTNHGGMHQSTDIVPDAALYGKTISSGIPFSALIGTDEYFSGIRRTFMSSVYWTESLGPAACIATLRALKRIQPYEYMREIGSYFRERISELCQEYLVSSEFSRIPSILSFSIGGEDSSLVQTYITEKMLSERILLASRFYPTMQHKRGHVDRLVRAIEPCLKDVAAWQRGGNPLNLIGGKIRSTTYNTLWES